MWLKRKCHFLTLFCILLKPFSFLAVNLDVRFCGFTQKCKEQRTDAELKVNPCCVSCECTDVCKEKGTCCSDKEGRNDTKDVITQECIPALYLPNITKQTIYVQSYYVRTRCPTAYEYDNIKGKCENDIPKSLQEVVFVSSEDGKIIYKNEFCALCHGESNTIMWQMNGLKINQCLTNLMERNANVTYVTDLVLANCAVIFKRPSYVEPQNVMCFKEDEVIKTCNESGMWDSYSREVKRFCENTAVSEYYIKRHVYKNIYCFLCNVGMDLQSERCTNIIERFPDVISFEIINLLSWEKQKEDNVCRKDQIFDKFFGRCKTLYCPRLSLPINGKCIPFIEYGRSYHLIAKFVSREMVNKSDVKTGEMSYGFQIIKRKLGFDGCELCYGKMYINVNRENRLEMFIQLGIRQARGCTTERIWSKLTSIERNTTTITLTIAKREIHFKVFWGNKMNESSENFEFRYLLHNVSTRTCQTWSQERGSYCPKVPLTMMEYEAVLKNHNNVNDLLFIPNVDDTNGTVFVCINGYMSEERSAVRQSYLSLSLFAIIFLHLVIS